MKRISEVFTDDEFEAMQKAKQESGMTWHDFLIDAVGTWKDAGDDV